jgi:hypothetical protein
MNNELAVVDSASTLTELKNTKQLCAELMQTQHYAKMGEAGVFAIVTCAKSLKMDPIYALNGALYYVQGKVGMGAQTMAAIIRSRGHSITKDPKSNDGICILHGKRGDNGDTWTTSFSLDDAKRAGICKNVWNSYPGVMCYNRAMSFMARQLFPDIFINVGYTPDELEEIAEKQIPFQEKVTVIVEKISEDQLMEFEDLMADCSKEHQEKFMKYLKESKIESYADIPVKSYEKFKAWALEWRAKHMASKIKTEVINEQPNESEVEQLELNLG